MTSKQAQWASRVRAWRQSGKTAQEFAEGKPFKPSTLRWWGTQIRRLQEPPGELAEATKPEVRMVAVRTVSSMPTRELSDAVLFVEVAGARIGVREGFDEALLRRVLAALGGGSR